MRCSGRMHVYVGAPSRRSQVARVAVMSRRIVGRDERGCGEGAVVLTRKAQLGAESLKLRTERRKTR